MNNNICIASQCWLACVRSVSGYVPTPPTRGRHITPAPKLPKAASDAPLNGPVLHKYVSSQTKFTPTDVGCLLCSDSGDAPLNKALSAYALLMLYISSNTLLFKVGSCHFYSLWILCLAAAPTRTWTLKDACRAMWSQLLTVSDGSELLFPSPALICIMLMSCWQSTCGTTL
jgi:hypothetical protein